MLAVCCAMIAMTSGISYAKANDVAAQSTQMIVVTTAAWDAVDGRLQRYERASTREAWQPVGDSIAIVVGRHGLGWGSGVAAVAADRRPDDPVKREGDGKSPAGVFQLGTAFGYASGPLNGSKMPYLELTSTVECVDDTGSKYYNRIVDRSTVRPDWKSSEHMRNTGEAYRWGIVVDHNGIAGPQSKQPVQGGGSCIFLHIWQGAGHGTAGCTAMAPAELEVLLRWLDPKRRPLLVQLTAGEFAQVMKQWKLPLIVTLPGVPGR
ncbi:L,D-transpeptidase family protein [Edaphobacter aggregans]|uniref:L,D-transpeptidase family protein n=1 Tax=Edaphobacter aggregans TaxID=570835 RepID=UPI00068F370A|nr:L,D-transpeptidase family protein [Edaphobacter aggregans]